MLFKCKMCGAELPAAGNDAVVECPSCGTRQTVARPAGANRAELFDKANRLRMRGEYDKALDCLDRLVEDDQRDAEIYWDMALCRMGVMYVEDPASHCMIPTLNRRQKGSILRDADYKRALELAGDAARAVYQRQAAEIDEIQQQYAAIALKEQPYDVFICYKETDDSKNRTPDSVLAQEIYELLSSRGMRAFMSRVSLTAGENYEARIRAALESASVMLVVTTSLRYLQSPWVRNEWSRFIPLMAEDKRRSMVVAYRGVSPYDLPAEMDGYYQAQDVSTQGGVLDLAHGIQKLLPEKAAAAAPAPPPAAAPAPQEAQHAALLNRVYLLLDKKDFEMARTYCDSLFSLDPGYGPAYLCRLLIDEEICCRDDASGLRQIKTPLLLHEGFQLALSKTQGEYRDRLLRLRDEQTKTRYEQCVAGIASCKTYEEMYQQSEAFRAYGKYLDAPARVKECLEKAMQMLYEQGVRAQEGGNLKQALELLTDINYKDAPQRCREIQALLDQREAEEKKSLAAWREKRARKDAVWGKIRVFTWAIVYALLAANIAHCFLIRGWRYSEDLLKYILIFYPTSALAFGLLLGCCIPGDGDDGGAIIRLVLMALGYFAALFIHDIKAGLFPFLGAVIIGVIGFVVCGGIALVAYMGSSALFKKLS